MQTNIINPDEVKTQLEALANDIQSSDRKAANRLHNLRVAVGRGNNADAWASADIVKLINPEQIIETYKNQPTRDAFISALEWGRNILIFLPLLVSWYGISQAVSKYSDFVGKHQDQITQPFLYLWQTGFGGELPGIFTLGSLAFIDAFLLGLLVFVTIMHTSLVDIGKRRRFQEAERLRADLSDALAGAALCLTTRNWQQPQNFVDTFDKSSRFFKDAIERLLGRIETLAQKQAQDNQIFAGLSGDLQKIMGTVSGAVIDLKNSNDALRQSMSQLVTPTQKISDNLEIVGATSQDLLKLHSDQMKGLQSILGTLNQWGASLQKTLDKLNDAVKIGQTLAGSVNDTARLNNEIQAKLKTTLDNQDVFTGNMVNATTDLRKFVGDFAQSLTEFQAGTKDFYALLGSVRILTERVELLIQRIPVHP